MMRHVVEAASMEHRRAVLINTTISGLVASMNATIVIVALPAIFRGLHVSPMAPDELAYLLWMMMGYSLVISSTLVLLGRFSDVYGRGRSYTLGFALTTIGAAALSVVPSGTGNAGALALILLRLFQAVGAALLTVDALAIITDTFPLSERGRAVGVYAMTYNIGMMLGLVLGGILAVYDWHLVFAVTLPLGIVGTLWSRAMLGGGHGGVEAPLNIADNVLLMAGLSLLALGLTYSMVPYGSSDLGWGNPFVVASIALGPVFLLAFVVSQLRSRSPLFDLSLFRNRPFAAGNTAVLLFSLSRGALMLLLTIWLQGIWLPLHGIPYEETPLWAGIYLASLVAGNIAFGPLSGALSDRYGPRIFAVLGMAVFTASLGALALLPYNFPAPVFELALFLNGVGQGLFYSPNATAIMNVLPPSDRGVGNGMRTTFNNIGQTVSMALFFTIAVSVFSRYAPGSLMSTALAAGVPRAVAEVISKIPGSVALFAAFIGVNPLGSVLSAYPGLASAIPSYLYTIITGTNFFPEAVGVPFVMGFRLSMYVAMAMALIAAVLSALMPSTRGRGTNR
ncbi:MFS transporter [Conexivisphaera calida]|uniref:MFS transporter n=1 Tax=Conexivisphaera calida TaxID=1874277 RepID=UPI001E450B55|nr:MFS transporter [Conexivisphaera calida]